MHSLIKIIAGIKKIAVFSITIILLSIHFSSMASVINPDDPEAGWKDVRAYRPLPILFLHGFGRASYDSWIKSKVDEKLSIYFSKYSTDYNSDPTILLCSRYPYLEIINFGTRLIDRNSSIDTYKEGDRYVQLKLVKPGDYGWSDKLELAVETLQQYYKNPDGSEQKIIFVTHSMGGLAARQYLKNYSNANFKIAKLIMIGTPNLGSLWATGLTTYPYNRLRRFGWTLLPQEIIAISVELELNMFLGNLPLIDIYGDAIWDMDPSSTGSHFISELNNNYLQEVPHFAIIGKYWLCFNLSDGIVSVSS